MPVAARIFAAIALLCGVALSLRSQEMTLRSRADPHTTAEWALILPHLPDPVTASSQRLESTADVLRARRFPDDALTYYKAAVINGGDLSRLLKKQGVVHLELQHGLLARLCFQQALRLNKRDAEAWNNLGAADFMLGNTQNALGEYKHAVKLNRDSAIFHSNLSLAYFEAHNSRKGREEIARAFTLDPKILQHNEEGGYNLHVLASAHYAEVCLEMARVSAAQGDRESTLGWLTKASERGLELRPAMKSDPLLQGYLQDERVKVLLGNEEALRRSSEVARTRPPSLGVGKNVQ